MKRPFKRILYGGDYNPNQWGKEVWKEDMRIFKDARINSATIKDPAIGRYLQFYRTG